MIRRGIPPGPPPPEATPRREEAERSPAFRAGTPWAWRPFVHPSPIGHPHPSFFRRDAAEVARDLLGTCLRSTIGGPEVLGVIVEVEAYVGPHDPASHAAKRIGRTRRNESMYEAGGHAYVYRSYGIHWCLNVVTGEAGYPAAVLIRGVDPIRGIETVRDRRGHREPLAAGPGRLTEALGVTGAQDGAPLDSAPLELLSGWTVPDAAVAVSGRIGIREAADWPLRFYLPDHPQVSRGPVGISFETRTLSGPWNANGV